MKKSKKNIIKRIMWITLSILLLLTITVLIFVNQKNFGKTPSGERLERIRKSPNYIDGKFRNLNETPQLTSDKGMFINIIDFLFGKKERLRPAEDLPSIKTDLFAIAPGENALVWLGHSSVYIQIDGKRILIDPTLSGAASPVSFFNKPFKGSDIFRPEDMPDIDYLIISHDHWDHLDYKTVMKLKSRIKIIICGLGVGEHFEHWGFNKNQLVELDWYENQRLDNGFTVSCLPARHFSGRGLSPNKSLWASFLLQTPSQKIYIGGDSGYDTHYKIIGDIFENIDLVILESGQYDKDWKYIHMMPEETVQAAKDLNAVNLLTVHNSKYALGKHPWDDPLIRTEKACKSNGLTILTPIIGEKVILNDSNPSFTQWWQNFK